VLSAECLVHCALCITSHRVNKTITACPREDARSLGVQLLT
jgi:hypothetical protein